MPATVHYIKDYRGAKTDSQEIESIELQSSQLEQFRQMSPKQREGLLQIPGASHELDDSIVETTSRLFKLRRYIKEVSNT